MRTTSAGAEAKGLSRWSAVRGHALRNAMLPIVTMIGMDVGLAFAGAVFVERVYGLPGVGSLLYNALGRQDMPVILGVVLLVTTTILIFNLIVDLLYAVLDPRVRLVEPRTSRARAGRRSPRRQDVESGAGVRLAFIGGAYSHGANAASKRRRPAAPITLAFASPPWNRITVGSESTPWREGTPGFSSTLRRASARAALRCARQLFEDRLDRLARPAPRRPEVDENRPPAPRGRHRRTFRP